MLILNSASVCASCTWCVGKSMTRCEIVTFQACKWSIWAFWGFLWIGPILESGLYFRNVLFIVIIIWQPLWSRGQSSWLQIQRSGFDSQRSQIFWEVVGLERGPLSLVSTSEELLGRNSGGSGAEIREYSRGDPLSWPRDTLYPQKLAITSPTSGSR
jgi:hypothetical protein